MTYKNNDIVIALFALTLLLSGCGSTQDGEESPDEELSRWLALKDYAHAGFSEKQILIGLREDGSIKIQETFIDGQQQSWELPPARVTSVHSVPGGVVALMQDGSLQVWGNDFTVDALQNISGVLRIDSWGLDSVAYIFTDDHRVYELKYNRLDLIEDGGLKFIDGSWPYFLSKDGALYADTFLLPGEPTEDYVMIEEGVAQFMGYYLIMDDGSIRRIKGHSTELYEGPTDFMNIAMSDFVTVSRRRYSITLLTNGEVIADGDDNSSEAVQLPESIGPMVKVEIWGRNCFWGLSASGVYLKWGVCAEGGVEIIPDLNMSSLALNEDGGA